MVSLEVKQEISLPITLKTTTTKSEPKLSFSDLLKGISLKKDDSIIQNGSSSLDKIDKEISLKDTKNISKNTALPKFNSKENFLTLLKSDTANTQELDNDLETKDIKTLLNLDPKLHSTISTKELKVLVGDAKEYLKFKISNSDGYKKSEIKELPKTLTGMVELAKKFDIDLSKITLQDVKKVVQDKKIDSFKPPIITQKIVVQDEKVANSSKESLKEKPLEKMLKLSKDVKVQSKQVNQEIPKDIKVQSKQENQEILKDVKVQNKQVNQEIPKDIKVQSKQVNQEILKDVKVKNKQVNQEIPKDVKVQNKQVNQEIPKDIKVQSKQVNQEIPKDIKVQSKQVNQEIPKDIKVQSKQENQEIPKDIKVQSKQENQDIQKDVKVHSKQEHQDIPKDVNVQNKQEKQEISKDVKVHSKQVNQEIPKDILPKGLIHRGKVQNKQVNQETPKDIKINMKQENQEQKTYQKNIVEPSIQIKPQNIVQHTTQQLVETKQFKTEEKPLKQKTDETLVSLLRGDKVSKIGSNLSADFSVASAKVIAPKILTEIAKPLEEGSDSSLSIESSDSNSSSKLDGLTTAKTDSFEVKINEAKQMVKYLSQDVKTAIDDYKSPFTRIKLQLNPQQLGEVDLTIVQRGKNLHVNLNSNTTAINTLSANINELRIQLNNSGINNATLNFNNTPQENSSNAGQQQNRQQEQQKARDEYDYFEKEDTKEEILSSLEIVVPNYA